jgi:hypothetical protein
MLIVSLRPFSIVFSYISVPPSAASLREAWPFSHLVLNPPVGW